MRPAFLDRLGEHVEEPVLVEVEFEIAAEDEQVRQHAVHAAERVLDGAGVRPRLCDRRGRLAVGVGVADQVGVNADNPQLLEHLVRDHGRHLADR